MHEAELEPRRRPAQPKDLTLLGIAELEAYIAELEAEIARVRVEIGAKLGQRRGAEALFKRGRREHRRPFQASSPEVDLAGARITFRKEFRSEERICLAAPR